MCETYRAIIRLGFIIYINNRTLANREGADCVGSGSIDCLTKIEDKLSGSECFG